MKKLTKRPARGIESRIRPLNEVERHIACLCYGDQKTGKTVFACSFPKPLLLIDIMEEGTDSIIDVDGVDVVSAESTQDLEDLYWMLESDKKYKSVVLDQMTGLQNLVIREMKDKKNQRSDDVFSQRSYGQLGGWMMQWILNYRNLIKHGKHVCFLSHQKRIEAQEEDDDRLAPEVTTALTGSITNFLLGAVSVIGNQFIRESYDKKTKETEMQYCMRLVSGFYRCGIRRPVSAGPVPEFVVNPTFDKMIQLSKGESLSRKVKRL
jgi:phage nucleotide-binding protein